jgi:hypothetical protein
MSPPGWTFEDNRLAMMHFEDTTTRADEALLADMLKARAKFKLVSQRFRAKAFWS